MTGRLAVIACLTIAAAAGCGSDDEGEPIPQANAAQIQAQLDNVEGQIDNGTVGACTDALSEGNTLAALESAVAGLPDDVDGDVRAALEDSVQNLRDLVAERCDELEADQTETTPPETETEPPPETETTPPDTNTGETVPLPPLDEDEEGNGEQGPPEEPGQGPQDGGLGPPDSRGGGVPAPGGDGE
jgi:hypothetical protein